MRERKKAISGHVQKDDSGKTDAQERKDFFIN